MGQQQLLLVILVTIIVGIATVVAINTFGSASKNANVDAVRQDLATIASSAQGYYMKPKQLGGGGNKFTGMTFKEVPFGADSVYNSSKSAANANGKYVISSASDSSVTVTATPAQNTSTTMTATITKNNLDIQ